MLGVFIKRDVNEADDMLMMMTIMTNQEDGNLVCA